MTNKPPEELIKDLLRQSPDLLTDALSKVLPAFDKGLPATFVSMPPLEPFIVERHADLVLMFGSGRKKKKLVIVVELQRWRDPEKKFTWPQYLADPFGRWKCEPELLIITPTEKLAEWAREPIRLGFRSQLVLTALGPETLPGCGLDAIAARPLDAVRTFFRDYLEPEFAALLEHKLWGSDEIPGFAWTGDQPPQQVSPGSIVPLEDTRAFRAFLERLAQVGDQESLKAEIIRAISLQLGRRVSLPGPEATARMQGLNVETLEALAAALRGFKAHEDLTAWLAQYKERGVT